MAMHLIPTWGTELRMSAMTNRAFVLCGSLLVACATSHAPAGDSGPLAFDAGSTHEDAAPPADASRPEDASTRSPDAAATCDCNEHEFCALGPACEGPGACEGLQFDCPDECLPTCGCDGNEYCNPCTANAVGVAVDSTGAACDGDPDSEPVGRRLGRGESQATP